MGKHVLTLGRPRAAGGIGLSVLLSLAPAAFAETYTVDPQPVWPNAASVGTFGSDSETECCPFVGVSHGGCSHGTVLALSIGDASHQCNPYGDPGPEAWGTFAVGLLGADARGSAVGVTDTGDASNGECPIYVLGCFYLGAAASGTGSATGTDAAVSGAGPATAGAVAVSGTNDANAIGYWSYPNGYSLGLLAVSGTGNASAQQGVAVSGTGNANGGTAGISVLGTVNELLP